MCGKEEKNSMGDSMGSSDMGIMVAQEQCSFECWASAGPYLDQTLEMVKTENKIFLTILFRMILTATIQSWTNAGTGEIERDW